MHNDESNYNYHQRIINDKDNLINELRGDLTVSENQRNRMISSVVEFNAKFRQFQSDLGKYKSISNNITELEDKIKTTWNPVTRANLLDELEQKRQNLSYYSNQVNTSESILVRYKNIIEESFKKNFIMDDFFNSYKEFLTTLTSHQIGALANLIFSSIILSCLISLIFIWTGDYLIKRFNLEERYPKLAKFIQLRRKFQNYYFIINIFTIFMCIGIQIYADIIVLTM